MITMLKKRSRNSAMLINRKIASILLKCFKTCNLVAALESRTDICTTWYVAPNEHYYLDVNNRSHDESFKPGPAVILEVID